MEEEKIELSPVEAISMLNWKKSKVYYWIGQGKFQTIDRIDGQKIVLTRSDIDRLRKDTSGLNNSDNSENSDNILNNLDNSQIQTVSNAAKNYNNFQNSINPEVLDFFQKSLETMKQMQINASDNYNYSLKLLTDGQSDFKTQYYELKSEQKTEQENFKISENKLQEKIKKFEKLVIVKNAIIAFLLFIIITAGIILFYVSNGFIKF